MSAATEVLLVGNCGPDTWALETLFKELGISQVTSVESGAEVKQLLNDKSFGLILLNRVFDATGELALDLLADLSPEQRRHCMLISNYPEAHEAAVKLGAQSGFGKRQLRDPQTRSLLQGAVSACSS